MLSWKICYNRQWGRGFWRGLGIVGNDKNSLSLFNKYCSTGIRDGMV